MKNGSCVNKSKNRKIFHTHFLYHTLFFTQKSILSDALFSFYYLLIDVDISSNNFSLPAVVRHERHVDIGFFDTPGTGN